MAIIGNFIPAKDSGWIGSIRTLTIDAKVRFVPNDDPHGSNVPTFKVPIGQSRIGHAWEAHSGGEDRRPYLSVKLDDPGLIEPISAVLFSSEDGDSAKLVWKRRLSSDSGSKVGP